MTNQVTVVNAISGHVIVKTEFDNTTLIRNVMEEIRKAAGGLWECRLLAKERQLSPIDKVSQAVIEGEGQLTAIFIDLKTDLKKEGHLGEFEDLMSCGFSVQELIAAGFPRFSPHYLRERWWVNLQELKAAGYSIRDFASPVPKSCLLEKFREFLAFGFSRQELSEVGLDVDLFIQLGFNLKELIGDDHSATDLASAGITAQQLKAAGFNAQQLQDTGFDAQQLKDSGFSLQQLTDAGFQAEQLKAAGFDAQQLTDSGFSLQQLKDAGF